jgi:hypothetical protein
MRLADGKYARVDSSVLLSCLLLQHAYMHWKAMAVVSTDCVHTPRCFVPQPQPGCSAEPAQCVV